MRDQKKTKSGQLTLVALTLTMLAVAMSFFLATTPGSAEEYSTMCPNGFTHTPVSSSSMDRNDNGFVCVNDKTNHVIDDNIIDYPKCASCHGA